MPTKKEIKENAYNSTLHTFIEDYALAHGLAMPIEEMQSILSRLHRVETTLRRFNASYSEGNLSKEDAVKWVQAKNYARKIVENELGFKITLDQDPNSTCICVILPSKRSNNNIDGETWRIMW